MTVLYREYLPRRELSRPIECFWVMRSPGEPFVRESPRSHRVLPDGCIDLIFDFGDPRRGLQAYFVGAMTRAILVQTQGAVDMLGIRFNPGGAAPFFTGIAAEVTDGTADLEAVWGSAGREVWQRLAELPDSPSRIRWLETALLRRGGDALELDPYVLFSVLRIRERRGLLPIASLEKGTGLSARQLERKFARQVGLTPKVFARVVRFQSLMSKATAGGPVDWAALALDHGYSDQPHLAREFREFAGVSPSRYLEDVGFVQDPEPLAR